MRAWMLVCLWACSDKESASGGTAEGGSAGDSGPADGGDGLGDGGDSGDESGDSSDGAGDGGGEDSGGGGDTGGAEAEGPTSWEILGADAGLEGCPDLFGAAAADWDADGYEDLAFSCHTGGPSHLLRNTGGAFEDVTDLLPQIIDEPPLEEGEDTLYFDRHVPAFADYDADGAMDLFLVTGAAFGTGEGYDQLYRQDPGSGEWTDVAADLGIRDESGSGRHALWFDPDLDGDLDLFIGHKVYPASPDRNHNVVWRNGDWSNQAGPWGLADVEGDEDNSGMALAVDLNGDLLQEVLLSPKCASSFGECSDEPDGLLTIYTHQGLDGGTPSYDRQSCAATESVVAVAAGDLDRDGDMDLVFGRADSAAVVLLNPSEGSSPCDWPISLLDEGTTGATAVVLADFNNDGWLDAFFGRHSTDGENPPTLRWGGGLGLEDLGEAPPEPWTRNFKVFALPMDVDRDGWVDLIYGSELAEPDSPLRLLRNTGGPSGQGLLLQLRDDRPGAGNMQAIGAAIRVEADSGELWLRQVQSGGSWHSSLGPQQHVGVGQAESVSVQVLWPDGLITSAEGLAPGDCYRLLASGGWEGC